MEGRKNTLHAVSSYTSAGEAAAGVLSSPVSSWVPWEAVCTRPNTLGLTEQVQKWSFSLSALSRWKHFGGFVLKVRNGVENFALLI